MSENVQKESEQLANDGTSVNEGWKVVCNHTFPVYLISTSLIPAETADMHTDIENKDFRP